MATPALHINKHPTHGDAALISARFADTPNCRIDLWMYESTVDFSAQNPASARWEDRVSFEFVNARSAPDGSLELEHGIPGGEGVTLTTAVTPFDGGVDIATRTAAEGPRVRKTLDSPVPNLCVQTVNADAFKSDPDNYQEFVSRCFIFTKNGRTFLDATTRMKNTTCFPADDPRNNPPKAQLHAASGGTVPRHSKVFGCGHSPDRFDIPVIGIVSRDGERLVAVMTKNGDLMWQAYRDCVHNQPHWEPDEQTGGRILRIRIVLMENDIDKLQRNYEEWS